MEKTIVFLHGFGEDHTIFGEQIGLFHTSWRVFVPDLPGSGVLKDYVWENGTETIEWMADWVYDQLQTENISECILLGHSMGGYITLAFAEKYPEMLSAFGLIHSTGFADSEAKKETRGKAILFMEEKGGYTFLKTAIPGLFAPCFSAKYPLEVQDLVEKARNFQLHSLVAYYRAMIARPDRTNVLKAATVQVLIIAGTEDMAVPLTDLLLQSSMPAICHFHILQDVGHMGMVEAPGNFHDILLNFFAAV
jgi:pimeloyl-ACP methyl ester carboxylesterase